MDSKRVVEVLKYELGSLDDTPHNPIVFKDNCGDEWCVLSFRPFRHDHRPTWREAYDLGYTLSRVRHVSSDVMKELP